MLKYNNLYAVIYKSAKDLFKNKTMLIINYMFPFLALLFKICFTDEKSSEPVLSFCTMNVVMIPILIMSSIIAEEKEKGTLRALISINVKPIEYLAGVSFVIYISTFISSLFFIVLIPIDKMDIIFYLIYTSLSSFASVLIGATIGLCAKNQVKVGATAAPISMLIGMLPVFSEVNPILNKISSVFYSGILSDYLLHMDIKKDSKDIFISIANIMIILIIFSKVYRRKGLCDY